MIKNKNKYRNDMTNRKSVNKKVVILALIVLLIAGSGSYLLLSGVNKGDDAVQDGVGQRINLDPPTAQDKQDAEVNKDQVANQIDTETKAAANPTVQQTGVNGKKNANISIASSNPDRIAAFISNVFEEGGVCTLTLTKDSSTITKQTTGFQNASYTQCPPFSMNRSEYTSSGVWKAVVHYESGTTSGDSSAVSIEVK